MANGFFGGGDGSTNNPFLIEDADDLNNIRKHLSSSFKIINDINLSDGKYNIENGWNPITDFQGNLNGNNHKIMNLCINRPTEDNVAFFRNVGGSNIFYISNIIFTDFNISGRNNVALLIGYYDCHQYQNVNIINSIFGNGNITGNSHVCGLIGYCNVYIKEQSCVSYYICNINNVFIKITTQSIDSNIYGITFINLIEEDRQYSVHNGWFAYSTINFIKCYTVFNINEQNKKQTYYSISNTYQFIVRDRDIIYIYFEQCYTDNAIVSPIIYNDTQYKNLSSIQYDLSLLPYMDNNYFIKNINKPVEISMLNLNNIYVFFNNGYYVYDFKQQIWVRKYTSFDNANAKKIIQNGMNRLNFNKITSSTWDELKKQYSTIKIINCINAHGKVIYHEDKITLSNYSSSDIKKINKKKIKFSDFYNDITNITK